MTTAAAPWTAGRPGPRLGLGLLIVALATGTGAMAIVGDGNLAAVLAPGLLALLVWFLWRAPLRLTLFALVVLAWVMESGADTFSEGKVVMPWKPLGLMLWSKLNLSFPVDALVFSGFDLLLVLLFAVILHRRVTRSTVDRAGWVDAPRAILGFAALSLAAVLWMVLFGLARGGSSRFALWQATKFLYLPFVYFLMREGLRGAADAPALGWVVLGVGLFRSAEAIVIRLIYPSKTEVTFTTTHQDSVLFCVCLAILVAALLEKPTRRTLKAVALLAPVYLWAMVANNRRLAWTELVIALVFILLVTPMKGLKRTLARAMALAAPVLMLYVAVGWNDVSTTGFGPVRTIRSLVDSKTDGSTLWRDLENYDLIFTYWRNPLLGSGFGHPFVEEIKLPDVTAAYELEPYIPHNSVLGLWAFGGLLGFSLLWMLFPVGIFFAVRGYHWSRTPVERIACLGSAAAQICYLIQGYGDVGFGAWGSIFLVGSSYALVGKICVANGAWPSSARRAATTGAALT